MYYTIQPESEIFDNFFFKKFSFTLAEGGLCLEKNLARVRFQMIAKTFKVQFFSNPKKGSDGENLTPMSILSVIMYNDFIFIKKNQKIT